MSSAQPRAPRKPGRPALPPLTTRPAAERDATLERIEERAREIRSIAADFVQHTYAPLFDEEDTRTGSLRLLKPKFLRVKWLTPPPPEGVVYDGEFFWEIKHGTRQVIRWTVARQKRLTGEKPRLDAGPFRFLGGIRTDELKKDYLVALVDPAAGSTTTKPSSREPPPPVGLAKQHWFVLVPLKPEECVEYKRLDVWIDRESLLPTAIRFHKKAREVETWTLENIRVNEGVSPDDFRVRVPRRWKLIKDPA